MFINLFEIVVITLSLSLTVYQDDASSVIFMFMMQYTLFFTMRNRGNDAVRQRNSTITIVVLLFLMGIAKTVIYFIVNKAITKTTFEDSYQTLLNSLGIQIKNKFYDDPITGYKELIVVDIWQTFDFEFLALVLNIMLLAFYSV